jgi:hypothetical protein
MVEKGNYQMAVDLLCCHLGISEDEAKQQLAISFREQREPSDEHLQQGFIRYELDC